MPSSAVPLSALFGKAEAADVKVSPGGKYIAWLARGEGVLNLWSAPLPPLSEAETETCNIPGARHGRVAAYLL